MLFSQKILNLLNLMSDGDYHSGETLGAVLGVSRAAVWKSLKKLEESGICIESVKGKGYRILGGLSLIDKKRLLDDLGDVRHLFSALEVFPVIDSTNKYLLEAISNKTQGEPVHQVCIAEMQTSGRGRRGKVWQSPFARNLYLSMSWQVEAGIAALEGLSLAVGVAIVSALESLGVEGLSLKWPNDILYKEAKLGGVLVEIAGDLSGACHVVVGVGLNINVPNDAMVSVDQSWVDLSAILRRSDIDRTKVHSAVVSELAQVVSNFETTGFTPFRPVWESLNAHRDRQVNILTPSNTISGIMRGVSNGGAAILEIDGSLREFVGGELSLRSML